MIMTALKVVLSLNCQFTVLVENLTMAPLMVQCAVCKKWFHLHCLDLTEGDLPDDDWFCCSCK